MSNIHVLPPLPYKMDSLAPYMSQETLEYHYGKHHKAYVDMLNKLLPGTEFENLSLEEIIKRSTGSVFNNAGQVWNHNFFWKSLRPAKDQKPMNQAAPMLLAEIQSTFGSIDDFTKKFAEVGAKTFGSGWVWLIHNEKGNLDILSTSNASNPIHEGLTPLLTCDVWEHAYYIDYRNARPKYLSEFWNICNWEFAEHNYVQALEEAQKE